MSPEQVRGEKLNVHSDIFSLGVVLYEMTTGSRPFKGRTQADVVAEILSTRPKPVHELDPKVPLDLERIITKALAPKPADRYQTMEDLAVDLKRLSRDLESGTSPSYQDIRRDVAAARTPRIGWTVGIAAALVVTAALTTWLAGIWIGREPSEDAGLAPASAAFSRTVLILPMEVRGQDQGADYAGRAFAEAIAVNLAQAEDLRVLPVPEKGEVGGSGALDRARAARDLGAGLLLTGAITRESGVVHASLNLVDTAENRIIWGAQRNAPEGDLTGLASSLAREGARKLGVEQRHLYDVPANLTGSSLMAASPQTAAALGAIDRGEIQAALEATGALLREFPLEHDAHVLRAQAFLNRWEEEGSEETRQALADALVSIERVDPESPYPQAIRAQMTFDQNEVSSLLTSLLERDDLTPSAQVLLLQQRSMAKRILGDNEGSIADLERALESDPANAFTLSRLGYVLREADRLDEALIRARQAVALEPAEPFYHHSLGLILGMQKRHEEAAAVLRTACDLGRGQDSCAALAISLDALGRTEEALRVANEAAGLPTNPAGSYNLACYWARAGDRLKALDWLERSVGSGSAARWMLVDPDLESLHGDPRFERLADRIRTNLEPGSSSAGPEAEIPH
jgi:tetratricopeptide (TPR) repeat protein